MNNSISTTLRAIGPRSPFSAVPPANLPKKLFPIRLYLLPGFSVTNPFHSAGIRKLPPMSLPKPIGEQYEPISPPSPPELPPQERRPL